VKRRAPGVSLVPKPGPVANRAFGDIVPGEEATRSLEITPALLDAFAAVSGDTGPIHVDADAARSRGFEDRVAHGALLAGLVSGIVGTRLPGASGVLHSMEMKFKHPCCVGRRITISVKVREKIPSVRTLLLDVTVRDEMGALIAQGTFQSGVIGSGGEGDGSV
jgi:3-hydroxybutyryl-CoA dehydratase